MTLAAFDNCIILVGLGAPSSLYATLSENISKTQPQFPIQILNWWDCADFGKQDLENATRNKQTLLIAHSAGGVIALQAIADAPQNIKRVIMLDTHALSKITHLLQVEHLLEIVLSGSDPKVRNQVIQAYQPIINRHQSFDASLQFAANWANTRLDETGKQIQQMAPHRVLHIGFTDSSYQLLDQAHEAEQRAFWIKYQIDKEFMPMHHFDLVLQEQAAAITSQMMTWLKLPN
ncbi:MAG TPA: alpha/beta hydrolase [Gammaproteobacteria bacterium]|nr:alpha/beta hydrolase [Gammaproteobacteria bacterium]